MSVLYCIVFVFFVVIVLRFVEDVGAGWGSFFLTSGLCVETGPGTVTVSGMFLQNCWRRREVRWWGIRFAKIAVSSVGWKHFLTVFFHPFSFFKLNFLLAGGFVSKGTSPCVDPRGGPLFRVTVWNCPASYAVEDGDDFTVDVLRRRVRHDLESARFRRPFSEGNRLCGISKRLLPQS